MVGERGNGTRLDENHKRTHHILRTARGAAGALGLRLTTPLGETGGGNCPDAGTLPQNTRLSAHRSRSRVSPSCLAGTSRYRHFSFFTPIHHFDSICFHICWSGRSGIECVVTLVCMYILYYNKRNINANKVYQENDAT